MKKIINTSGFLYIGIFIIVFILVFDGLKKGKMFGIDSSFFTVCLILSRVLCLFLHELSHACFIRINGMGIKMFNMYGFTYKKCNNTSDTHKMISKNISFSFKEFKASGYVIPEITYKIDTVQNFVRFKKAYINSLLAGPICPLVIAAFGVLFSFYFGQIGKAFFITFMINSLIMLVTAFVGNNSNMGDIQAVLYFKDDVNLAKQLHEDLYELKKDVSTSELEFLTKYCDNNGAGI